MHHSFFIKSFVYAILAVGMLSYTQAAPYKKYAPWVGDNFKGVPCRGPEMTFGPYDYLLRHQLPKELHIVEKHHFAPSVEQLIQGQTTTSPMGDISYTLTAWPNHHRALYSAIRFRVNTLNSKVKPKYTEAECFLQRAIHYSPEDGTAYMLYGILLHQTKHKNLALKNYRKALELQPQNAQAKYNLALLLVDLKKYAEAKKYALELYTKGYPLPGLKDNLKSVGQWNKEDEKKLHSESSGIPKVE
ncbi:MAG: tetratricopeptide repeat protein [Porticoccus sp.]|nr:tetratricopeptide repeat protein [Porticoccus sp.]